MVAQVQSFTRHLTRKLNVSKFCDFFFFNLKLNFLDILEINGFDIAARKM